MKFFGVRVQSEVVTAAARRSTASVTWRVGALALVAAFYAVGVGVGCTSESTNADSAPPDGGTTSDGGTGADDAGGPSANDSGGTSDPNGTEAGDGRPRHAPSSLLFGRDRDPKPGFVAGTVVIGKAADESDVSTYNLYWASDASTPLGPAVATFPKTGSDITYELDAAVPGGASHLIAVTANDKGERKPGANTPAFDNFPVFADITLLTDGGVTAGPSAVVDETNKKLLVAVRNAANQGRLGLVHCDLDGTNCKLRDLSGTSGIENGSYASAVIDKANGKLFVATRNNAGEGYGLAVFSSNLDGSAAKRVMSSTSELRSGPSAVLDAVNNKLLVAVTNKEDERSRLFRVDLGASNNPYTTISPDPGKYTLTRRPIAVLDEANGKVLVVAGEAYPSFRAQVLRCDLSGANCTSQEVPNFMPISGWEDRLAATVDTAGRKLLVAAPIFTLGGSGKLGLARCDLDTNAGCTNPIDISAGQPDNSGMAPVAVIDSANGKLLVVAISKDHFSTMGLFRCELDGTACTHTDISVGHEGIGNPSAVIDKATGRLLVVANYDGTRLGLFSIGLW